MELRTRQAPVPHANIMMPTRPMTDALAGSVAEWWLKGSMYMLQFQRY